MAKKEKGPLLVRFESAQCLDALLIDTPPINVSAAWDALVKTECR